VDSARYPQHDFPDDVAGAAAHRPWPMPSGPWLMTQSWHDLLFAHWPVDVEALRSRVPPPFEIDTFEGQAWLGIVPFYMTNVAPRAVPALPGLSSFPELNVRPHVRTGGRAGVFFFSLDAASRAAVRVARLTLNLPYHHAVMATGIENEDIVYQSRRTAGTAEFVARYGPFGPAFEATPGSLEYFLTERYCLYAVDRRGRPYRLEIHHAPWRLQTAAATIARNTMAAPAGITLPAAAPLLHYARRQDTIAWWPSPLAN
jgi:uncharacterized protein YqjF (DUF2071 family)